MSDTKPASGLPTGAAGIGEPSGTPVLEEANIVVSDMHLGEGPVIRYRRRSRVFGLRVGRREQHPVTMPNPLEDFPFDNEFAAFLAHQRDGFRDARILRVRLMGDVFDPLAVTMDGKFKDLPYEAVGLLKMRKIIQGHPAYFDALAEFIRDENARLDIFVGNHDLFLVWKTVQREIVRRLAGDDRVLQDRIRFIDRKFDYQVKERDVLYYHGMNAEPHNMCDAKTAILTNRFGTKLKHPVLNMPYGSYMTLALVNFLKLRNPLIGRIREEKELWTHALRFKWGWGLYAGFMLLWHFIYSQVFAFWDFRRKSSFKNTIATVLSTTVKNPVDKYAMKLLKQEGVRVVVLGHSHTWRRVSSSDGTYINTGSWSLTYRLEEPKVELTWGMFPKVEFWWRATTRFFRTGEIRFFPRLKRIIVWAAIVATLVSYLVLSFPNNPQPWLVGLSLQDLKIPFAVLLGFMVLGGLFRFLAVPPTAVNDSRFTFGLIRHYSNGDLKADTKEWVPSERSVKECV